MNFLIRIAQILLWTAPAFAMLFAARQMLQYAQLGSYQVGGYLRTLSRQAYRVIWPGLVLSALSLLIQFLGSLALRLPALPALLLVILLAALLVLLGYVIGLFAYREKQVKVPLVFTARMKRLCLAFLFLALLACLLLYALLPAAYGFSALLPLLLPIFLLLALLLIFPFEKGLSMLYRLDAHRILDSYRGAGLQVIGVTGSYGKTTVKNILQAMLSQQLPSLASPASFNTPMGLARTIREELAPEHRFFIAEMGARHPQDIRVLSRFIRPESGILTSIGPQHLQTLGSIQRVASTKYALIAGLPRDGFAVFSDDGAYTLEAWQKTQIAKALAGGPGSDLWAEDIISTPRGSSFTLCTKQGQRLACQTALPGEHNVRNILLAAAMALHLGISLKNIAKALPEVAAPPSRLQTSLHPKGYTIINNGFNSNPDSSRGALQVLASYPGRLVVATPGFIELGRQERRSNQRLGNDIAAVAQLTILIGEKHTRPVLKGLLESGMAEENIHIFPSLAQANIFIEEALGAGDVLLYENDLPDHYN